MTADFDGYEINMRADIAIVQRYPLADGIRDEDWTVFEAIVKSGTMNGPSTSTLAEDHQKGLIILLGTALEGVNDEQDGARGFPEVKAVILKTARE